MEDCIYNKLMELTLKTDSILHGIDKLSETSKPGISGPIIAALITSILGTLLAQAIDRAYKSNLSQKKDLREIHSKSINLKIRLKDLFRQLAMYKFHAQYWWHIHRKESNEEFSNRYYLEHLRSQSDARIIEKEIGQVKADFLAETVKYERLKGKNFNVDLEKTQIEAISFEKAKSYEDNISADELKMNHAEQDEQDLRETYFNKLTVFQSIIDKMV